MSFPLHKMLGEHMKRRKKGLEREDKKDNEITTAKVVHDWLLKSV